jgi:hypothetical protein
LTLRAPLSRRLTSSTLASLALALGSCTDGLGFVSPGEQGCDKVDILFVVDNSASMENNQANLVANFPGFSKSIVDTLGTDFDYHVGVVTTDAFADNPPQCQTLGALVSQTRTSGAGASSCFEPSRTQRFLRADDALGEKFACLAKVGTGGSGAEDVIGAIRAALSAPNTEGCNQDFLRPDSLLVLVILTDEDVLTPSDISSWQDGLQAAGVMAGQASTEPFTSRWVHSIAEASQHHEDNTLVISIASGIPGNQCANVGSEETATALIDFTKRYKNHYLGDICAPSYGDVFAAAIEPLHQACKAYEPKLPAEQVGECSDGPSRRNLIAIFVATVLAGLFSGATLVVTWAPRLAQGGRTQSSSNAAAYAGALTLAGTCGALVAWSQRCGFAHWSGALPLALAAVGALLTVIALLTGRAQPPR